MCCGYRTQRPREPHLTKRRLSKQQLGRIAKNQGRELGNAVQDTATLSDALVNGVVISHFGKQLDIEPIDGAEIVRCHQRANLPALVTGDRVVWEAGDDGVGVVLALGERRSVLASPVFGGVVKPMAANIDVVLVVLAPTPMPMANLIDRYLVAIETLGLQPLLILNKSYLKSQCEDLGRLEAMLEIYRSLDYAVLEVSATTGDGLTALAAALQGITTVLVGQSGVGKSSLVNALGVDKALAPVGGLSTVHDKGMHTTTTSRLFNLAGFDLIDSPGIREFGLGHISPQQVFDGFVELRALAGQCKFRDCAHQGEPDCALQAAVEAGTIHEDRLSSYFQILDSL